MKRGFPAPVTVLFEFDFAFYLLFIFARKIVGPFANGTVKFY